MAPVRNKPKEGAGGRGRERNEGGGRKKKKREKEALASVGRIRASLIMLGSAGVVVAAAVGNVAVADLPC